ncbi:MAG: MBL fold metallo-hydrolase [Solirubrobacteraceae bacterium]
MTTPASDLRPVTVDLHHLGHAGAIAAHLMGDVIVDPGAELTIERVVDAVGDRTPRAVLLTHIHFDHAGGTGALVERWPEVEVWVHERGARHLVDPTRLLASARKVYGDYFEQLWGRVIPVPEANLRVLEGGERIGDWAVAYTPGHAQHHVSYLHEPTRTAFTGDVTGIRMNGGPAFPPTPPPDIDPPAWHHSLDTIAAWAPARLAFSHFGQVTDAAHHLALMHEALDAFTAYSATTDATGMAAWIRAWLAERAGEDAVEAYSWSSPFEGMWSGLDRWRRMQAEAAAQRS